jgi:hypothetical protein
MVRTVQRTDVRRSEEGGDPSAHFRGEVGVALRDLEEAINPAPGEALEPPVDSIVRLLRLELASGRGRFEILRGLAVPVAN